MRASRLINYTHLGEGFSLETRKPARKCTFYLPLGKQIVSDERYEKKTLTFSSARAVCDNETYYFMQAFPVRKEKLCECIKTPK